LTVAAASLTLDGVGTPQVPFPESGIEGLTAQSPGVRGEEFGPDEPPWGILGAVGVWLMSFIFMLVTQTVCIIAYVLYRHVELTRLAEVVTKDPAAIFVAIVSLVPAHLLTVVLAWVLVTRGGKRPFLPALGWDWGRDFTFWRSAGVAVALLLVGVGIIKLTGNPENELSRLIESSRAAAVATAFLATVTAPFVEEVIYRGVLYSAIRRAAGKAAAVTIVFLLFAAIHVPQYWPSYGVIATILLLSLALTLIRAHTGRLLPCFVVHLIFNGIQSLLIVLDPYIDKFSPEKTPGPDPSALVYVLVKLFFPHV
jgi:membrane protease YdiL (CAAX protease family)